MPIIEIRMPDDEKEGTEASLGVWFKAPGEMVSEHEPLVEINTDKVTIEIAAPASGRIGLLIKQSGDQVLPGELLGTIESGNATPEASAPIPASETQPSPAPALVSTSVDQHTTYSPAVRKLLAELGLDPESIKKSTRGGRITPQDIAAHLKHQPAERAETQPNLPAVEAEERVLGKKLPHTPMRKSIARHMLQSVIAAPHVTSVFEADLFNVMADRNLKKQNSANGEAPSVTAYILRAAVQAIKQYPEVNSKWHDAFLEQFDIVNFGVGTALENGGLVVPVIRDAQDMSLSDLSEALRGITKKAREGKLTQADMEDGTFTLSNHGVGGSLFAAPIILPHGQAAILGTGKIQKRPLICETGGRELFRVRPMMYVTLTVDHRALDGQQTNGFLTQFVRALETPV